MAFRREMVFEAMREVLVQHGLPPLSYKLNVARLDSRGHRFAVMVDLVPHLAGRVVDSPGEWQVMEDQAAQMATSRYRVRISNVYWRLEHQGFAAAYHAGSVAVAQQPKPSPVHTAPVLVPKTANSQASAQKQVDDFPDTQIDDRLSRNSPSARMSPSAKRSCWRSSKRCCEAKRRNSRFTWVHARTKPISCRWFDGGCCLPQPNSERQTW
jgi:hypothetical protein